MFKRVNNWHLSLMVVVVSVFSILLIQQYVTAQTWNDPSTLPGSTPNNTFLVNPLADDIDLNGHGLVGTDLELYSAPADQRAIILNNSRQLCLSDGSGGLTCRSTWPTVSGGITGSGTTNQITKFTSANIIGDSSLEDRVDGYIYKSNGGIYVSNTLSSVTAHAFRAQFGSSVPISWHGLHIDNAALGESVYISDTNATKTKPAFYLSYSSNSGSAMSLQTKGNGNAFYINDTSNSVDSTPFVIDKDGEVGIGVATPTHSLDIYGQSQSAEITLLTQSTGYLGTHWGIYHHNDVLNGRNELTFWNGGNNQAKISSGGNLWLRGGQICDINGQNCWSGAASGNDYWTEDGSQNLSRPEASVYLLASTTTSFTDLDGNYADTRLLWYPERGSFRAGAFSGEQWNDYQIPKYSATFGWASSAQADNSFVAGRWNFVIENLSVPINTTGGTDGGWAGVVSGGENNRVYEGWGTISGGADNRVWGIHGTVAGGQNNWVDSRGVVGGGQSNTVGSFASVIAGGEGNKIATSTDINSSRDSTIGGGNRNFISSAYTTISGGAGNCASGDFSVISGGGLVGNCTGNRASSTYAVIGGGNGNILYSTASYAVIGGGLNNSSYGAYSTIAGGKDNSADGDYSFAGGRYMRVSSAADRTFAWGYAGSPASITRDNTFSIFPVSPGTGSAPRVGIGTASPNAALEVRSLSENAEIDIRTGSGNHWGIYQSGANGNLNFWYLDDIVTLSSKGIAVNSDGTDGVNYYVQLDENTSITPGSTTDCASSADYGRMIVGENVSGDARLWICYSGGWEYVDFN